MTEPTTDELARWAHEGCREWIKNTHDAPDRCGLPSVVILWGKLFDPEALGPRCEDHAAKWLNGRLSQRDVSQSAVFDLRPTARLLALVAAQAEQIAVLQSRLLSAELDAGLVIEASRDRANAAEAKIARVRALCERGDFERDAFAASVGSGGPPTGEAWIRVRDIRAALDGTEAPA